MDIAITRGTARRRAVRHDGWTIKRRAIFLEELAHSCNVSRAAGAAGPSIRSAYGLRRRDPAFAKLWANAIDEGAERLEQEMLALSLGQLSSEDNPTGPCEDRPVVAIDVKQALAFLKWRAEQSRGPRTPGRAVTPEDVTAALAVRLEALHQRLHKR